MTTVNKVTSRVGRKPILVPNGVELKINGDVLEAKGSKGVMSLVIHPSVTVDLRDSTLHVEYNTKRTYSRRSGQKLTRDITGTMRSKIANVIQGVSQGFERKLLLVGVGYRAQAKGSELNITIGYSHPVNYKIPNGIVIETPTQTEILIKGVDKHLVGHVASIIRAVREPEPYKGKGIRYSDEVIILKETKKK